MADTRQVRYVDGEEAGKEGAKEPLQPDPEGPLLPATAVTSTPAGIRSVKLAHHSQSKKRATINCVSCNKHKVIFLKRRT